MNHTPHVDLAFNSVEHIMRDVEGGYVAENVGMDFGAGLPG